MIMQGGEHPIACSTIMSGPAPHNSLAALSGPPVPERRTKRETTTCRAPQLIANRGSVRLFGVLARLPDLVESE